MGKTGSIEWAKVKGRGGRTIKVPKSRTHKAHPGPAQRFMSTGAKRRWLSRSPKSIAK